MESSESRGFKITVFIVTAIIAGVLLACVIYFNQIRNGTIPSKGEMTAMLILSGVLFAITLILWIWALIRLFVSQDIRSSVVKGTVQYFTDESGGVTLQDLQGYRAVPATA